MEATATETKGGEIYPTEVEVLELIASSRHHIGEDVLSHLVERGDLGELEINCVDGRPDRKMRGPYIRRFGGAGGYAINLIGALRMLDREVSQLDRRIVVKVVRDFLGKDGFFVHGAEKKDGYHGCGHCFNAVHNHLNYGLARSDSEGLDMLFMGLPTQILQGGHEEKAVLIVHTPELIHKNTAKQLFVWNVFLDDIILGHLSQKLATELALNDPEQFLGVVKKRRDENVQATLRALEIEEKGIPIYEIK